MVLGSPGPRAIRGTGIGRPADCARSPLHPAAQLLPDPQRLTRTAGHRGDPERLAERGEPGGIVVELTEQTPIDSYVALEPDLNQLRAAGALIAVDDAGAGYAGLRHLLALRPSLIKIDRELIQDVDRDEAKRALIEMLGTFASRVDAWILAEGVERVEELDALVSLGVPLVQGYYLARPAPPWAGIDLDLAHRLASKPPVTHKAVIRDVLESAATATTAALAAEAFAANPALQSVVLIGDHLRPGLRAGPGGRRAWAW